MECGAHLDLGQLMIVGDLIPNHNGRKGALVYPDNVCAHVAIISQEGEVAIAVDNWYVIAYNFVLMKGDHMELQINTKYLTEMLGNFREEDDGEGEYITDRDYLLTAALIGIMERLERLHGAVLSLQRDT